MPHAPGATVTEARADAPPWIGHLYSGRRYDLTIAAQSTIERTTPLFAEGSSVAGRYRIEGLIGEGSASAVYRVHDARTGLQLALKQLRTRVGVDAAAMARRFEHEYHKLAQLAHPRIVAVHDYGIDSHGAFYTMDLLDGSDLHALGTQPWQSACTLLYDVASAFALLHSRRLVYRDLSPRNVRCDRAGRATLFDFGALGAMTTHRQIIGTPPFVPPEAVELQALDGRTDLYGLGGLAYWLLTGSYAYPARTLRAVHGAWRIPPLSPRQLGVDVPGALDDLVMQLLQLEREARPSTAAEVMERLSGITGHTREDLAAVGRAYVVTPPLIGRDPLLQEVRDALLRAEREGCGACFVIEGAHGSGRSRMLDSCVLEARLRNLLVLRADAAEGAERPYGLARALCSQLRAEAPELCRSSQPDDPGVLAVVFPELRAAEHGGEVLERAQQQLVLRDFFAAGARQRAMVIAVDDLESADPASAGVLAALCHAAGDLPLILLMTRVRGPARETAETAIRALSTVLPLAPLEAPQTLLLLRSIFGEVEHLHSLAEQAQRMSQGNFGLIMALCEWMVEQGSARYHAGDWRLPAVLCPELPASMSAALWTRVASLPGPARELAEALALTEPLALAIEDLPTLSTALDRGQTFRALDTLVSAGVLVGAGERYRFAHEQLQQLLVSHISPERALDLRGRVVQALTRCGHPVLLPLELAQSGRELEAIQLVLQRRVRDDRHPRRIELLERLVAASERLKLPVHTQLELRLRLVSAAADVGDLGRFEPHARWLGNRLERDSGLRDHHELPDDLPPDVRRARALEQAQQRYSQADPSERALRPEDSLTRLLALCLAHFSMAGAAQDVELVERLPSLEAWSALSPAVYVIHRALQSQNAMVAGRYDEAMEISLEVLHRIEQPDRANLEPAIAERTWILQYNLQGLMAAAVGNTRAEHWIGGLEHRRGYRALAARLRMVYQLMHVQFEAAAQSQRQAELFDVLDGGSAMFPEMTVRVELLGHLYGLDIRGVKRGLERVELLAQQYPKWQPTVWIIRSYHRRLQGDFEGCCKAIESALAQLEPGRHFDWGFAVGSHVGALVALGRPQEAFERGQAYLELARRERLTRVQGSLLGPMIEALLKLDRVEDALPLSEEYLSRYERVGARGLLLAMACEVRGRVALLLGDLDTARRCADRCAEHSAPHASPTASPLYRRLHALADTLGYTL